MVFMKYFKTFKTYHISAGSTVLHLPLNNFSPSLSPPVFSINKSDLPNHEFSVVSGGDLVLEKSLDYELRSEYEMRIMVRQEETDTRDVISVRVRVSNVNDWSPTFR